MLCDDCRKRPATIRITTVAGNDKVEKNVCEKCAQAACELDFGFNESFTVQDFLKGMFSQPYAESAVRAGPACPGCGLTFAGFSRAGKIGCGECYSAFADRLEAMVRRIHGPGGHTGKVPGRRGGLFEIGRRTRQLRKELEEAVQREEYEQAARLRDEIRALEQTGVQSTEG